MSVLSGMWPFESRRIAPVGTALALLGTLCAGGGCGTRASQDATDYDTHWFELSPQGTVTLRDEQVPVRLLSHVEVLSSGELLAADNRARLVRHFGRDGHLIRYYGPREDWRPGNVQVDEAVGVGYANDIQMRLWRFAVGRDEPAEPAGLYPSMLDFHLHPTGALITTSCCFDDGMEVRTYLSGNLVASFLPSDERNIRLGKHTSATVTVDADGTLYTLQAYQPVVRKFSVEGKELGSWEIRRNEYFRDFPDDGPNPFEVSRDWEFLEKWRRSFTSFGRIYWVPPNLVCVFQMNDPPARPNVLDVYTTDGAYVGSAAVTEYLVGARGRRLYFTEFHVFPHGDCVVKVYELPAVVGAGRADSDS